MTIRGAVTAMIAHYKCNPFSLAAHQHRPRHRHHHVCIYLCKSICTYVRTYVRTYVCMYVCMYAWVFISSLFWRGEPADAAWSLEWSPSGFGADEATV